MQGERHNMSVSWLQSFLSGTPYGATANVGRPASVVNPGYRSHPGTVGYWFTDRDAFHTDDITRTDLSLNYAITFGKRFEIFIQPEVINVFDEDGVTNVNTAILVTGANCPGSATGNCQGFNPLTTTPVEGVNWAKGPNFGEPTVATDYQTPRTFRVSVGFRF